MSYYVTPGYEKKLHKFTVLIAHCSGNNMGCHWWLVCAIRLISPPLNVAIHTFLQSSTHPTCYLASRGAGHDLFNGSLLL